MMPLLKGLLQGSYLFFIEISRNYYLPSKARLWTLSPDKTARLMRVVRSETSRGIRTWHHPDSATTRQMHALGELWQKMPALTSLCCFVAQQPRKPCQTRLTCPSCCTGNEVILYSHSSSRPESADAISSVNKRVYCSSLCDIAF